MKEPNDPAGQIARAENTISPKVREGDCMTGELMTPQEIASALRALPGASQWGKQVLLGVELGARMVTSLEAMAHPLPSSPEIPDNSTGAQLVETRDAFTPIPESVNAPTPELWRAYEAFNDTYRGYNTQQALRAAINGVLAEREKLAQEEPRIAKLTAENAELRAVLKRFVRANSFFAEGSPSEIVAAWKAARDAVSDKQDN